MKKTYKECPTCQGTGEGYAGFNCPLCRGKGEIEEIIEDEEEEDDVSEYNRKCNRFRY